MENVTLVRYILYTVIILAPLLIGLKWMSYFNTWVFFPGMPNVFDVVLLAESSFSILILSYLYERERNLRLRRESPG